MMSMLYKILSTADYDFYRYIIDPKVFHKIYKKFTGIKVKSIQDTAKELATTNKSLGRFGDGEIAWIFGKGHHSFEKPTQKLSKCLYDVITSNDKNFMIGLPDSLNSLDDFTKDSKYFWETFFIKNYRRIIPLLNKDKIYYNTSVTRPYIDYNKRSIARETFRILKTVWDGKNVLIVEGNESRLGVNDGLFSHSNSIKRIECPVTDAFENHKLILSHILSFLNNHKNYITLLSLGPTATILAYKLYKLGYRAIDIGHVDVEYNWFKIGAKEKINLPYRYVNEVSNGHSALPVNDSKYANEIIDRIN